MANKKVKIVFFVLGFIFLLLLIGVLVFFFGGRSSAQVKQYETQLQQENDAFLDDLIGKIEDSKGQVKEGPDKEPTPTEPGASPGESPSPQATVSAPEPSEAPTKPEEKKLSQAELDALISSYDRALGEMQAHDFALVDSFIASGKADWEAIVKAGNASTASKGKLVSEYISKAGALEQQMDASFERLIASIEKQLQEFGVDSAPIVEGYRSEYKSIKQSNKQMLIDKLMAEVF